MSSQMSWELRKQMLEDRIKNIASLLTISHDQAFMRLVYALIFNTSYDDPSYEVDLVDGGDDKQIDILKVEDLSDQAVIHLIQAKNNEKYSGNVVVQMRNGLDWVFRWPEEKFKQITNKDLVAKIGEVRELSGKVGLRKLDIVVHYVAKGNTSRLSPNFQNEVNHIIDIYSGSGEFRSFQFKVWGVNELIDKSYENEQEASQVNADIPIYFTHYAPAYSQYRSEAVKAVICTVDGDDLAMLVNKYQNSIFEENVRTYLGARKKINSDILQTCSNDEQAEHFWFLNNGITVTCSNFDIVYNVEKPFIRINNMQIVNGCQTSMTLAEAQKEGLLSEKTRVMLKVYASQDPAFIDRITLATNSQNAVSSRDLRSNDIYQRDIEKLFVSRGYFYERKVRMFAHLPKSERRRIISNEKLGQAHLAVVQHLPAVAMSQPSKIWAEYYDSIYTSKIEELLGAYLIYNYCVQKRNIEKSSILSTIEESVLKYGTFHLARVVGSYQIGEDWKNTPQQRIDQLIQGLENNAEASLNENYQKAREILQQIVEDITKGDFSSVINVFKSSSIHDKINEVLRK